MSDPIDSYFERYPDFDYHHSTTDWRQIGAFNALAAHLRWNKDRRQAEWDEFKSLWTSVVEREFQESSLDHYQSLCEDLGIDPIPESTTACKRELSQVYVNIVDLVQYRKDKRAGRFAEPPQLFDSLEELSEYSISSRKWYPRQNAKAEMLRELLKVLD